MRNWKSMLGWFEGWQNRWHNRERLKPGDFSRRSQFGIEAMEPRFLLSADLVPVDTGNGTGAANNADTPPPIVQSIDELDSITALDENGPAQFNAASIQSLADSAAPVARNDHYFTREDTPLTVSPEDGVLDNDGENHDNPLTAALVSGPGHGTLTLNANGSFTYTPAANFNGTDSFTYKANDGSTDSNVATVHLRVGEKNDAPVGNTDTYSTNEDTTLTIAAAQGTLTNDTDPDGDPLSTRLVDGPAHGKLKLKADGSFTYTPDKNFNGSDTFTYVARDGDSRSNPTSVNITVNAVNDAPVAANDSYTVNQNTPLVIAAGQGTLANDTDTEGSTLTATLVQGPSHGTLTLNANGSFTYTPTANFLGADSFTYKANDGTANSGVAGVSIFVSPNTSTAAVDLITDPNDGTKTALRVFGTNSDDTIRIVPANEGASGLEVFVNDVSKGTFNPTGRIIVYGLDGNDKIRVGRLVDLTTELYGGAGDDRLRGSGGLNILIGGNGNDFLAGGKKEDLMIGGAGSDRLRGTRDGDIMIGGSTVYDSDATSLNKIMSEWSRTDKDRSARIPDLSSGGGLNGTVTLTQATVLDDDMRDRLRRRTGLDWLFFDQHT